MDACLEAERVIGVRWRGYWEGGAEMNEGHEPRCSDKLFTSFFNTVLPGAFHWACQVPTKDGMGGEVSLMPVGKRRKQAGESEKET